MKRWRGRWNKRFEGECDFVHISVWRDSYLSVLQIDKTTQKQGIEKECKQKRELVTMSLHPFSFTVL